MDGTFDAVIVGTGVGGLTAGLTLAREGRSVLLLEAGKQYGGMLNPFARKQYHFDIGVHYVGEIHEGGRIRRLLDRLELDVDFRKMDGDCIDRYFFGDRELWLVEGAERWRDYLAERFPSQRKGLARFFELMRACGAVQRVMMGIATGADKRCALRHAATILECMRVPFAKLLSSYFSDPLLRSVIAGPCGDIALPPSRASSYVSIMVLNHFVDGGYYPKGGSGPMRDAYVQALHACGAVLQKNRLVESIESQSGGGFVVSTNKGERYSAPVVVSNADITHTVELLRGARPNWLTRRKLRRLEPSLGAFMVFVGTDLDLSGVGLTDANVWHYPSADIDAAYAPLFDGRMPEDPMLFLSAPTLKDPDSSRAPPNHHTLELITFTPPGMFDPWFERPLKQRGADYERLKTDLTARLLRTAERYAPGLRDHVQLLDAATPATAWHFVRAHAGGIYGPAHTPGQSFPRRFFPSLGVPGLYQVGSAIFGAGIGPCMASGFLAGRSANGYLGKRARKRLAGGGAPKVLSGPVPELGEAGGERGPQHTA